MTKGIVLAALVVATFTAALLTNVGESSANFHLMRIESAMAGANGDTTIQFVELRSANVGQNVLSPHVICFFDTTGAPYAMFRFPAPNPTNSADGASYLVGTAEFDAAWPDGAPDFTFSPANTTAITGGNDVDHPIRAPGGKISFGSDLTMTASNMCQGGFSPVDTVAYGTAAYGGTVDYGDQFASDLPTSSTSGLHIVGPVCIEFSAHTCASPRDNSVNYSIVDLNASGNQPRNSANLTGPINADADADGVANGLDLCAGTVSMATVDANGCAQAQVDKDADGACDPGAPSAGPAPGCTGTDNCPRWPNPAQALPSWTVPANDVDCDGFTATAEAFTGTDPARHCAASAALDDEPTPDAWPMDFNDDQMSNLSDVLKYRPVFNSTGPNPPYDVRFDLNGDNMINLSDVLTFPPYFNKACV